MSDRNQKRTVCCNQCLKVFETMSKNRRKCYDCQPPKKNDKKSKHSSSKNEMRGMMKMSKPIGERVAKFNQKYSNGFGRASFEMDEAKG